MSFFLRDATSFFFSNFPDRWSSKDLWFIFARFGAGLGRIADVFIPGKKDRRGGRFGFVKFKGVNDIRALLHKLNLIWLGSYKLRISLAKDRKTTRKSSKAVNETKYVFQGETRSPRDKTFNREIKTVVLESNDVGWEWFSGCAVRVLTDVDIFPILQDSLWDIGLKVKIVPMGGPMVLPKPESKKLLIEFINEDMEVSRQWFLNLKVWSPDLFSREKYIWVRLGGLPLHAWNPPGFKAIGDAIGKFISVDYVTENFIFLDTARILVSVPVWRKMISLINIKINQVQYTVSILEESGSSNYWWINKQDLEGDSEDNESRINVDSDMEENCCS
ncbi:hypothetical protein REPUB_Repub01dG0213500 [Reevesia pubescens]